MLLHRTKPNDEEYFGYYDPRHRFPEEHIQSFTDDGVSWLLMTVVNMELVEGHKAGLSSEDLEKKLNLQWKFCERWIKVDSIMRRELSTYRTGQTDETTDL